MPPKSRKPGAHGNLGSGNVLPRGQGLLATSSPTWDLETAGHDFWEAHGREPFAMGTWAGPCMSQSVRLRTMLGYGGHPISAAVDCSREDGTVPPIALHHS